MGNIWKQSALVRDSLSISTIRDNLRFKDLYKYTLEKKLNKLYFGMPKHVFLSTVNMYAIHQQNITFLNITMFCPRGSMKISL